MDKYYLCLKDFVMLGGGIAFCQGKIYLGYGDLLRNEFGRNHIMSDIIGSGGYFNGEQYFRCLGSWDRSFMFKSRLRFPGRLTAG